MDDKRFYRELKQQIKRIGTKKLRRYLKNVDADPDEFDYGSNESSALNGRDGKNRKKKEKPKDIPTISMDETDAS